MSIQSPSRLTQDLLHDVQTALLSWYAVHARQLPWRDTTNPYAVWVSEVMLQQTQVKTVIPYYNRFMRQFPSLSALAAASDDDLAMAWAGLGYYRRVRNLQAAVRQVIAHHQGKVPDDWQVFRSLPGVGDYTAGAVLSIAYQKPYPAVDGNVKRVLARFFAVDAPLEKAATFARIKQYAQELLPHHAPGLFNQALMELGALVCTPKRPQCDICPVAVWCKARLMGNAMQLPVRLPRKKPRPAVRVCGVIRAGEKTLFKRRTHGVLQGYWELPGRQLEEGEKVDFGVRQLACHLSHRGLAVRPGRYLGAVAHTFSHVRWHVHIYALDLISVSERWAIDSPDVREPGTMYTAGEEQDIWAWLTPQEVRATGLPVALRRILDKAELKPVESAAGDANIT
ncbi:MAG TPA: A/G-specific adenine glycosylase [Firmicutes bacterium]|nr:A/G-specific adenine glycosylase [Bacillota bacterium]